MDPHNESTGLWYTALLTLKPPGCLNSRHIWFNQARSLWVALLISEQIETKGDLRVWKHVQVVVYGLLPSKNVSNFKLDIGMWMFLARLAAVFQIFVLFVSKHT